MNVTFYHSTAERNVFDKTPYLTDATAYECTFASNPVDVAHPVIMLAADVLPSFNYCQIQSLGGRFYFVDRVEIRAGGLYMIYMTVDVLMTYKTQIGLLPATIARNQYEYDAALPDDRIRLSAYPQILRVDIPKPADGHEFITTGTSSAFILATGGEQQ